MIDFAASLRQTAMDKGSALRAKVTERIEDAAEEAGERPAPARPAPDASESDAKAPYAP